MPLIYSFVARGSTVLADYTSYTGNFSTVALQVRECVNTARVSPALPVRTRVKPPAAPPAPACWARGPAHTLGRVGRVAGWLLRGRRASDRGSAPLRHSGRHPPDAACVLRGPCPLLAPQALEKGAQGANAKFTYSCDGHSECLSAGSGHCAAQCCAATAANRTACRPAR